MAVDLLQLIARGKQGADQHDSCAREEKKTLIVFDRIGFGSHIIGFGSHIIKP